MEKNNTTEEKKGYAKGVFQAGVMVTDVDECLRLFVDTPGMHVVFDARNQVQPAKGLAGNDHQVMNCLMLRGDEGVDLEIHQYVDPPAVPCRPLNHNEVGSMHFMLKADDIDAVLEKVEALGYHRMNPVVERPDGFKFTYFRGPDGMMIELHQGDIIPKNIDQLKLKKED